MTVGEGGEQIGRRRGSLVGLGAQGVVHGGFDRVRSMNPRLHASSGGYDRPPKPAGQDVFAGRNFTSISRFADRIGRGRLHGCMAPVFR
jgi:hypothetical protein